MPTAISATRAAAMAVVKVAILRQRRDCLDRRMTVSWSTAGVGARISGATMSGATGGAGGGASGNTSGACGSETPMAVLIRSQTSGLGSMEPTIWFNTPSRNSHAATIAVK